jgi:hypothetical protein
MTGSDGKADSGGRRAGSKDKGWEWKADGPSISQTPMDDIGMRDSMKRVRKTQYRRGGRLSECGRWSGLLEVE